jgi:DMSO/TMAO reductase YedYZ molybdopterin-dependent catalytic subunit
VSQDSNASVGWRAAAACGVAAAAVALAVGEIAAAVPAPRAAPLSAVDDVVVAATPGGLVRWATSTFGTSDKFVLGLGTVIVALAFAGVVGVAARRRLWFGFLGIAAFSALGVAAAVTRQDASWWWGYPSIIGGVAGGAVLWGLLRLAVRPGPEVADPLVYARRRFLYTVGATIGGAAVVGYAARAWGQGVITDAARDAVKLPAPTDPAPGLPSGARLDVKGITGWKTSNADFYRIDTALTTPRVDPSGYRLRIHGRVHKELTLSFDDLLKRDLIERDITLSCVSNEVGGDLVGNARWIGVRLDDLLDEVRPHAGADQLVGRSVDGFTAGAPTKLCRDGRDAMLAVGMNGVPLPVEHGFPVRMIVPGLYGYVSATKWLTELELTSFDDFDSYWIPKGWALPAPVKTASRIDVPRAKAGAGTVAVAGVAWAQHRGISKVEVQVDSGQWHEARLSTEVSGDTWRQWVWSWDAKPGDHTLTVRATDGDGKTQTSQLAPPEPSGASGWHSVEVTVSLAG